jgi:hypothetical protein
MFGFRSKLKKKLLYEKFLPTNYNTSDVYLVSYPKSGNTWISFLLANTINLIKKESKQVNFFNIHDYVPDMYVSRNIPNNLGCFPRIIKSHANFNPYYYKVLLLVRDPRDVMVSYYKFLKNLNVIKDMTLSKFIRNRKYGIENWLKHSGSWFYSPPPSQSVILFRYEDFFKDTMKELSRMFTCIGYNISEDILKQAVKASDKNIMKIIERETESFFMKKRFNNFNFVRKGDMSGRLELLLEDRQFIAGKVDKIAEEFGYKFN